MGVVWWTCWSVLSTVARHTPFHGVYDLDGLFGSVARYVYAHLRPSLEGQAFLSQRELALTEVSGFCGVPEADPAFQPCLLERLVSSDKRGDAQRLSTRDSPSPSLKSTLSLHVQTARPYTSGYFPTAHKSLRAPARERVPPSQVHALTLTIA